MKPTDLGLWKRYRGDNKQERTITKFNPDGTLQFQDHMYPKIRFVITSDEFAEWAKEEVR